MFSPAYKLISYATNASNASFFSRFLSFFLLCYTYVKKIRKTPKRSCLVARQTQPLTQGIASLDSCRSCATLARRDRKANPKRASSRLGNPFGYAEVNCE